MYGLKETIKHLYLEEEAINKSDSIKTWNSIFISYGYEKKPTQLMSCKQKTSFEPNAITQF